MAGGLRKEDFEDVEIIDAVELAADGASTFKTAVPVTSTTAATKRIVVNSVDIKRDDDVLEVGDIIVISGAAPSSADGTYTVAAIVDSVTFDVNETITDSSGGTCTWTHPPGAKRVGVDPTNIASSSSTELQQVLEDLDSGISGGMTPTQHKVLRQLIHFLEGGPGGGFASGAFEEITGGLFPTSIIWWESVSKLKKIVEKIITRSGGDATILKPTPVIWKVYDTDGSTVLTTVSDAITYAGVAKVSALRTIS